MIIEGTIVNVADGTGVLDARCIKVFGNSRTRQASLGDRILVVIRRYSLELGYLLDEKKKEKFKTGRKFHALVIRVKRDIKRSAGVFFKFYSNSVILINKRGVPLSGRVRGPVMFEVVVKRPVLGSLTYYVV